MKKVISITLAALMSISAMAQSPHAIECIYKWTSNHPDAKDPVTETGYVMLNIMGDQAISEDYSIYRLDSIRAVPGVDSKVVEDYQKQVYRVAHFFEPVILHNFVEQSNTVVENVVPDRYRYTEDFVQGWEMTDDEQTIAGYKCQSAKINYGGRTWTAWYTEELPFPAGPWKLGGLPGLILRAEDSEGLIGFEIAVIRTGSGLVSTLPDDKGIIGGDRDEIIALRNRVMQDPMKNISMSAISDMQIMKNPDGTKLFLVNNVQLREQKNGYIPLEKE